MGNLITPDEIAGSSVYGVRQVQYTVDGVSGRDFIDALTVASFRQAVSIEETTSAYAKVVNLRQAKIDELSQALAYIAKASASFSNKAKSTDTATIERSEWVKSVANKYGVSLTWESGGSKMTCGNIWKAQTNFEYAMDKEDNYLQQDMVTLQSYLTKRDNAYSNASKLVRKGNDAASSTISNVGT